MRIALGTVQFGLQYGIANQGGRVELDDATAIVRLARSCGLDTLDTAAAYGDSEARLGTIGVADWRVVTKVPAVPEGCSDVTRWLTESVCASLERLRIPRLYGLLLHRPLQLAEAGGGALHHALRRVRDAGLAEKIGVSVYGPEELDAVARQYDHDIVQAPYSVLDRRLRDSGWLARLHGAGVEVHTRSAFLQGLLLTATLPERFRRWESAWRQWQSWLAETHLTPLQACVRFVLAEPAIARVVVGVDSPAQLRDIIASAAGTVPRAPDALAVADVDLLNPARWELLQ